VGKACMNACQCIVV